MDTLAMSTAEQEGMTMCVPVRRKRSIRAYVHVRDAFSLQRRPMLVMTAAIRSSRSIAAIEILPVCENIRAVRVKR